MTHDPDQQFTLGNCLQKKRTTCQEEKDAVAAAAADEAAKPTLLQLKRGESSMATTTTTATTATTSSAASSPSTTTARYFANPYEDFQGYKLHPVQEGLYSQEEAAGRIGDIVARIDENKAVVARDKDSGVYGGPMGVVYAFWHVADTKVMGKEGSQHLMVAADAWSRACMGYIVRKSRQVEDEERVGFLLGHAGAYAVDSVIAKHFQEEERMMKDIRLFDLTLEPILEDDFHSDGLLEGRGGWLCAALWLRRTLDIDEIVPIQYCFAVADAMFKSGRENAARRKSPCPLMYENQNLGAARGLSSILLMFMNVPGYLSARPEVNKAVKATLNYLLTLQRQNGHFPTSLYDKNNEKELVQWCSGSPGVVYVMARAYEVYGGQEYLRSAIQCGEVVWQRGLLRKGPGLCHGIAGNAYAFLLLYRLIGDDKHLYRAIRFAQFMEREEFLTQTRTPDRPFSLFEGLAGTACFLADLADPAKAKFPFLDIF